MNNKYLRAMSVIEYTMAAVIIVAALLSMQVYLKRAISGRWRQSADTFGYGRQYDAPEIKIWGK